MVRRPVLPSSASALFYTKVIFGYLRYTKRVDDFFLFFFGISSSNRLADDARAVGEFQKKSPQYRDAYVRYTKRCDDFLLVFFGMYSVSRDGDI